MEAEILELKKALTSKPDHALLDIFDRLMNIKPTAALLKKTEIGLAVSKFRKHSNDKIAEKAKAVVKKWKQDVGVEDNRRSSTTSEFKSEKPSLMPDVMKSSGSRTEQREEKTSAAAISPVTTDKNDAKSASHESLDSLGGISVVPNKARTIKSDDVKLSSLHDKLRDKSVEMLYSALGSNTDADSETIVKKAYQIEKELFNTLGGGNSTSEAYRDKVRSLFLNLRDQANPTLRLRVLAGSIDVSHFCKMTPDEMKSRERQLEDRKLQEENLFLARGAAPQEAETDQFKCGKCKQRRCRYYQMQTRSADEPMTTFVTCVNCGHKWKFC